MPGNAINKRGKLNIAFFVNLSRLFGMARTPIQKRSKHGTVDAIMYDKKTSCLRGHQTSFLSRCILVWTSFSFIPHSKVPSFIGINIPHLIGAVLGSGIRLLHWSEPSCLLSLVIGEPSFIGDYHPWFCAIKVVEDLWWMWSHQSPFQQVEEGFPSISIWSSVTFPLKIGRGGRGNLIISECIDYY